MSVRSERARSAILEFYYHHPDTAESVHRGVVSNLGLLGVSEVTVSDDVRVGVLSVPKTIENIGRRLMCAITELGHSTPLAAYINLRNVPRQLWLPYESIEGERPYLIDIAATASQYGVGGWLDVQGELSRTPIKGEYRTNAVPLLREAESILKDIGAYPARRN